MTCGSCGTDNISSARFCGSCGALLLAEARVAPREVRAARDGRVGAAASVADDPTLEPRWEHDGRASSKLRVGAAFTALVVVVAFAVRFTSRDAPQEIGVPDAPNDLAASEAAVGEVATVREEFARCLIPHLQGRDVPGAGEPACTAWVATVAGAGELSGLALDGDLVFVSGDGVAALGAASGDEVWRVRGDFGRLTPPAVRGGAVVVASADGYIHVFERDGDQRWSVDTGEHVRDPVALSDATVVVGAGRDQVHAYSLDTGDLRWAHEGAVHASISVGGATTVVGYASGDIVGFDVGSGRELWRAHVDGAAYVAELVTDLVVVGGGNGGLYAFDTQTGAQRWHRPTAVFSRGRPVVSGERVHAVEPSGIVHGYERLTGDEVLRASLGAPSGATPVVGDSIIVARTAAGGLAAVHPETGDSLWRYYPTDLVDPSSPALAGGRVYATFEDRVIALQVLPSRPQALRAVHGIADCEETLMLSVCERSRIAP